MVGVSQTPALAALKASGPARAVGWIGLDVPLELVEAAGFIAIHVTADPGAPSPSAEPYGEGLGNPRLRALAGAVIELADEGLERLLVATTPAWGFSLYGFLVSLQRAGAALQGLHITAVDVLHDRSPADHAHTIDLFGRLSAELTGGAGPDPAALATAIADRNTIRERLSILEGHRRARQLSGVEALSIHAEGDVLGAQAWLARLDATLAAVAGRSPLPGRPVVVSGSPETAARTYRAYEAHGLLVVGDDHDAGSRAISPRVDETANPLAALAERYRARTPEPSGWTTAASNDALSALVSRQGAEAVIFDIPLYDHPAAWDFPKKRAALEAAGVDWALMPPDAFRDPEAAARQAAQGLARKSAAEPSDA